jgi:hypothetical protein
MASRLTSGPSRVMANSMRAGIASGASLNALPEISSYSQTFRSSYTPKMSES